MKIGNLILLFSSKSEALKRILPFLLLLKEMSALVQRKMQRRHAMSPNSIEAIRLRGFCETLRQTRTRNEMNESSSESEAFCQYMNIGSNRSQVNFAAPSA